MTVNERLLTSKQVCELLHITPRTLRRWCQRKIINYIVPNRGAYRFRPSAIQNFIDRHRQLCETNANKKKGKTPRWMREGAVISDKEVQNFFESAFNVPFTQADLESTRKIMALGRIARRSSLRRKSKSK